MIIKVLGIWMNIKLGIIYGILIWFFTYLVSTFVQPVILENVMYINLVTPLSIIILTGFFGILYIREIDENEVIEGITVGIIFIIIDVIMDLIFFIIPHRENVMVANYPSHVISMLVIVLTITTLLGYLAQMNIELK